MAQTNLTVANDGNFATLTFTRAEKRNALDGPLWWALKDAAEALSKDPPRAVIITGGGGHFCAGMDLSLSNPLIERLAPAVMSKDETAVRQLILDLKAVLAAVSSIPCPVIAAIEGACAGGGLEVALACDLRVAADGSFYSLPETLAGMIPDLGGTVRSLHLLGRARATELILTGRRLDAAEAHSWGLVNRLCGKGASLETARALALELSASAPAATREALRVLRHRPQDESHLALETDAGVQTLLRGECMEGTQAFMEKRQPNWVLKD